MRPAPRGWWVIDKPVGQSSRTAVVHAARWLPKRTPLGHTGTLDPLASGVLVLAVGGATRLTEEVQHLGKEYDAEATLGFRSATDDGEGPITRTSGAVPDRPTVEAALARFVGAIEQVPPAFSAVKVGGQRAYRKSRRGEAVELSAKRVRIDAITVTEFAPPKVRFTMRCGKGTYVRSVARDLGDALGCGAYLSGLRRTRVGPFTPADAVPWGADADAALAQLLPLDRPLALAKVVLADDAVARVRQGQAVIGETTGDVAIYDESGELVAIGRATADGTIRPVKVFAP